MTPAPAPAGVFFMPRRRVKICCLRPFPGCAIIAEGPEGGKAMLGENIKALRKARGLSQQELAERLHVVRQTVSKWEQGVSQS